MDTRKHVLEEVFCVSEERLFSILHTPSAIRKWWNVTGAIVIPKAGGVWAATWGENEDKPDYTVAATIKVFEPPRRLVLVDYIYHSQAGGLPFEAKFETEFLILPHETGAILRVTQSGFPIAIEADEYFSGCVKGWRDTFIGIRNYIEIAGEEV